MSDLLTMLPIFLFMLIPVWIPLIAAAFGALADAVRAPGRSVARQEDAPARPAADRVSPAGRLAPAAETAR